MIKSTKLFQSFTRFIILPALVMVGMSLQAYAAGPAPVDLLSTTGFAILSKTGVTNTGSHMSAITGNVGASPIAASFMNTVFCPEVTGVIYGVDATYVGNGSQICFAGNPPMSNKTLVDTAILDMQTAYAEAKGRTIPDATELHGGAIGGKTFTPGLYKWSTDVFATSDVTLSGGANDVWIFQIAGDLRLASAGSVPAGVHIVLTGGAKASNVYWQVGGSTGATIGTYATFNGTILSAKQVILQTGAVLNGRALAQSQVVLDASTITAPAPSPTQSAKITIIKYIDGVRATSVLAGDKEFPMSATWSAQNIGSGSGQYALSASGFNGNPTPYQAITSDMTVGASYTTSEITGGAVVGQTCTSGQPFALKGYSVGDRLISAEQAPISNTAPNLTNILNDIFVAVHNISCPTTGGLTITKTTPSGNGTFWFTSDIPGNSSFSITTIGNNGHKSFSGIAPGTYHVSENTMAGWTMRTNACATVTVALGSTATCAVSNVQDPTTGSGQIHGIKFEDISGTGSVLNSRANPLAGWTLYIDTDKDGTLDEDEPTSITDDQGHYKFMDLPVGIYRIREVNQPEWIQTYPAIGFYSIAITPAKVAANVDFGNFHLASISGVVFDDANGNRIRGVNELGLGGRTINLTKLGSYGIIASTETDALGNYSFDELRPGTYSVREILPTGWVQTTPNPVMVTVTSGVNTVKDFGNRMWSAAPMTYSSTPRRLISTMNQTQLVSFGQR